MTPRSLNTAAGQKPLEKVTGPANDERFPRKIGITEEPKVNRWLKAICVFVIKYLFYTKCDGFEVLSIFIEWKKTNVR